MLLDGVINTAYGAQLFMYPVEMRTNIKKIVGSTPASQKLTYNVISLLVICCYI